jgi:hypothetical protein
MTDEQKKLRSELRLKGAWMVLSINEDFNAAFLELQIYFGMFQPSFREADSFNPHAAAKRDGNKEVLNEIARRIAAAKNELNADATTSRPSETTFDFAGETHTP